jgi:acyl-CoA thioester hydrolase
MEQPLFSAALEVRDYECDLQGIVNNAVYQQYLEHVRHLFLKANGLEFARLTAAGTNLVVVRAELDYLFPLRSGDRFRVDLSLRRVSRLRFAFHQEIVREPDGKPVLRAVIIGTSLNAAGRPHLPAEVERLLATCAAAAG